MELEIRSIEYRTNVLLKLISVTATELKRRNALYDSI